MIRRARPQDIRLSSSRRDSIGGMAKAKTRSAKRAPNEVEAPRAPAPAAPKARARKAKAPAKPRSAEVPPPARPEDGPRFSVRRTSTVPPTRWSSRCKHEAWPGSWIPSRGDEALAQQLMLLAHWYADQLANPELSEERRAQLAMSVRRASSMLSGDLPELVSWVVACAVRCHGALLIKAHEDEKARIKPGGVLDALLDGHTEQAVADTVARVQAHHPKAAAWLSELERRGRPELRNALGACGRAPWQPDEPEHREALRRLLALVLFATERVTQAVDVG